jgi:hypothetical protein
VDELMTEAARGFVERLLMLSAQEVAGAKHPGRACRYRDADMVLRWTAAGYLQAEKSFRRVQGFRDLWILAGALGRQKEQDVVQEPMVA